MASDTKRLLYDQGKGIQAAGPSRGGKLVVAEVAWHRPKKHLDPVGNSDRIHVSNVTFHRLGGKPKTPLHLSHLGNTADAQHPDLVGGYRWSEHDSLSDSSGKVHQPGGKMEP